MERTTYALRIAYDGACFRGWQRQRGERTVQQALEDALAGSLGEKVHIHGAARTDAGAHAEGQVASFSIRRALSSRDLLAVPVDAGLRIVAAARAPPSFHARASAIAKRYRYCFSWGPPSEEGRSFHLGDVTPDWDRARTALAALRELPHLSGLSSPASVRRPAPPLDAWSLEARRAQAQLVVTASAFRKHQVRNLAGHLAAIALGLAEPESLARMARATRPWRGATAPAQGLTLLEVIYGDELDPFRDEDRARSGGPAPPLH
jgi:tRNA pseudouridine38-40 synthase